MMVNGGGRTGWWEGTGGVGGGAGKGGGLGRVEGGKGNWLRLEGVGDVEAKQRSGKEKDR